MTFADAPKGRDNNLSFIRFVISLLVIYYHAFAVTGQGTTYSMLWSRETVSTSHIGLYMLFFYGGFLLMRSMEKKQKAGPYFRARCLRVFPSLWIVVLLCVLILGPLMTTCSLKDYFLDARTPLYLLNGLLIPVHDLPGVFESNPYLPTVNGSLWSLPVEFICYALCYRFFRLNFSRTPRRTLLSVPLVLAGTALGSWVLAGQEVLLSAIPPALYFYLGMLCYLFRDRIPKNRWLFVSLLAAAATTMRLGLLPYTGYFLLPYIFLFLAFGTEKTLSSFGGRHELSYQIYLLGWPVQQTLVALFPGMSWAVNCLGTLAVCFPAALALEWAEKKLIARLEHGASKKG